MDLLMRRRALMNISGLLEYKIIDYVNVTKTRIKLSVERPISIEAEIAPVIAGAGASGYMCFAGENRMFQAGIGNNGGVTNGQGGNGGSVVYFYNDIKTNIYIHVSNTGNFYVNGVSTNISRDYSASYVYLLGNSMDSYYYKGKVYRITITGSDNDVLYDFIPCTRKSDNKEGLYDSVNKTFYEVS